MSTLSRTLLVVAIASSFVSVRNAVGGCPCSSRPTPTPSEESTDAVRKSIGHKDNFKDVLSKPAQTDGSTRDALVTYVANLPDVKGAGKPSLIFLHSQGELDPADPMAPQMLEVARACRAVEQTTLHTIRAFTADPSNRSAQPIRPSTWHDFRVAIGSSHFNCSKVNLFNIDPKDNPKINMLTAPVIVVTDVHGEVVGLHSGEDLNAASVFESMAKVMQASGYANFDQQITSANKDLNKVYQANLELMKLATRKQTPDTLNAIDEPKKGIDACMAEYEQKLAKIAKAKPEEDAVAAANAV